MSSRPKFRPPKGPNQALSPAWPSTYMACWPISFSFLWLVFPFPPSLPVFYFPLLASSFPSSCLAVVFLLICVPLAPSRAPAWPLSFPVQVKQTSCFFLQLPRPSFMSCVHEQQLTSSSSANGQHHHLFPSCPSHFFMQASAGFPPSPCSCQNSSCARHYHQPMTTPACQH